jgi:hypothetical protein
VYDRRPFYNRRYWPDEDAVVQAANRQTSGLVGIVVILLLLIVGLFLVHRLRHTTLIEDCLMAGRTNCDVIVGTN